MQNTKTEQECNEKGEGSEEIIGRGFTICSSVSSSVLGDHNVHLT